MGIEHCVADDKNPFIKYFVIEKPDAQASTESFIRSANANHLRARRTKNLNRKLKNEKPLSPSHVPTRDPVNSQMHAEAFTLEYAYAYEKNAES